MQKHARAAVLSLMVAAALVSLSTQRSTRWTTVYTRVIETASPRSPAPPLPLQAITDAQLNDSLLQQLNDSLLLDAAHEWPVGSNNGALSAASESPLSCTELLQRFGLCDPALLHVPKPNVAYRDHDRAFVFLHFSKCSGTSLISKLAYLGYADFSLKVPSSPSTYAGCDGGLGPKCCWWRERLHNLSSQGVRPKILTQEPANQRQWFDGKRVVRGVDPGFEAARDLCADLAYVTVLRKPIIRTHSHMCEVHPSPSTFSCTAPSPRVVPQTSAAQTCVAVAPSQSSALPWTQIGADFRMWQEPDTTKVSHVTPQLRDNYYVRALGGAEAWAAPEGGLGRPHLLAAARTLARFDVVMTVATLAQDAPAQMGRVGLAGFEWHHSRSRSRQDNLERARRSAHLRGTDGAPACEAPPNARQLDRLLAACAWDAILYEFARLIAARRTTAASSV